MEKHSFLTKKYLSLYALTVLLLVGFTGVLSVPEKAFSIGPSCSLREAIEFVNAGSASVNGPLVTTEVDETDGVGCVANALVPADSIHFAIPGAGPHTIVVTSSVLPNIATPTTIDGTTQSGASCGTDTATRNLLIAVNGNNVASGSVLRVLNTAPGSVIKGLAIYGSNATGIDIGADSTVITCNHVGVDETGLVAGSPSNQQGGIFISAGDNVVIGGSTFADLNVLSANGNEGIFISSGNATRISGNYIGVGLDGFTSLGNGEEGIDFFSGGSIDGTIIGGSNAGEGNIIANTISSNGINLFAATNVTIQGNTIGLDGNGNPAPNNQNGIGVFSSSDTILIGGTTPGARNIISGNNLDGINTNNSSNITIQGNYVGTTPDGLTARGNGNSGIKISSINTVRVGGIVSGARNIVSGNQSGIDIDSSLDVVVEGNYVGLGADGDTAVGNFPGGGIFVGQFAGTAVIGGTTPGSGNVVSNNGALFQGNGMVLTGTGIRVEGNIIGLDATGTKARPNGTTGIAIIDGANGVVVGGTTVAARNIISANAFVGIGFAAVNGTGVAENNRVQGNYIGTDINGNIVPGLGNARSGIVAAGQAQNNLIGGSGVGEGNLIAGNNGPGVEILKINAFPFAPPTGHAILGNSIYGNGGIGIDYDVDSSPAPDFMADDFIGVTVNDIGDVDSGPNNFQNYPVAYDMQVSGPGSVAISFYLDSLMAQDYRIEFFRNATPDASGHGGGEEFLTAETITHTGSGVEAFTANVTGATALVEGDNIAMTATVINLANPTGFSETSEFSSNSIVGSLAVDFGDAPDASTGTGSGNYNTVFSDNGPYHIIGNLYLGQCVDGDSGLNQNTQAEADDTATSTSRKGSPCSGDEDGIFFPVLTWGSTPTINVVLNDEANGTNDATTANALVDVWIDLNVNGSFEDAGEHVVQSASVTEGVTQATQDTVASTILSGGSGTTATYARVRVVSSASDYPNTPARPLGEALIGEVEDYRVVIFDAGGSASIQGTIMNEDQGGIFGGVVLVKLYLDNGPTTFGPEDTLVSTEATASGVYQFANVPAGSYWIVIDEGQASLAQYVKSSGVLPTAITVGVGEVSTGTKHGFRYLPPPHLRGGSVRTGCTDATATNYDKFAAKSDGSCQYPVVTPPTIPIDPVVPTDPATPTTPTNPTTPTSPGTVDTTKTCAPLLKENLSFNRTNTPEQVQVLKKFLRDYEGESLEDNGIFDQATREAVIRFQEKYSSDVLEFWNIKKGTGYVYFTTRAKINAMGCKKLKPQLSCPYFEYVREVGTQNDGVLRLQTFLNANEGEKLTVDGIFTQETKEALKRYQLKNKATVLTPWGLTDATGLLLQTTRKQLHRDIGCFELPVRLPNKTVVE